MRGIRTSILHGFGFGAEFNGDLNQARSMCTNGFNSKLIQRSVRQEKKGNMLHAVIRVIKTHVMKCALILLDKLRIFGGRVIFWMIHLNYMLHINNHDNVQKSVFLGGGRVP